MPSATMLSPKIKEAHQGIFGQHLEETMLNEGQCGPQRRVPALVEQCACFIRDHGLREEGLFRASGQTDHVRALQDAFDRGESLLFDSATDVHTVASLLKLYLRELPEPVIPFIKYAQFLSCALLLNKNREMGILELGKQVKSLPKVNYNLLEYICRFLDEVQSHSDANKMSVHNLATVFGPNVLRPRVEDPVTIMEGSSQVQHLMTVLIREHARLYHLTNTDTVIENALLRQNDSLHKGKVEWLKQEAAELPMESHTGAEMPQETLQPCTPEDNKLTPSITTSETDKSVLVKSKAEDNGVGHVNHKKEASDSPTKQPRVLSAWRCSFKGSSVGLRGKIGGSAGDVSPTGGSNWLMNGLSSLRAHRRTTSSGAKLKDPAPSLKDSTLLFKETPATDTEKATSWTPPSQRAHRQWHRLSAYDNVAPSTLSLPAHTSPIWTAFDISLAEPEDPKRTQSDGTSNAEDDVLTTIVVELQQELKTQRMSFECSMRKLEENCHKHQAQVNKLEEELDQERKRCHMLEIRFRNSERARQDAENRNVLLQREMEDFFKTLEDLTSKPS